MDTRSELVHLLNIDSKKLSVEITRDGSGYKAFNLLIDDNLQPLDPALKPPSCTLDTQTELYVIDSVRSGTGRTPETDFYDKVIRPVFEILNLKHTYLKTTSSTSIASFASELDCTRSYTMLFLSGDTSVSEFLNNLPKGGPETPNPRPTLSILPLPMGTGNALASSLGYMSPVDALRQFLMSPTRLAKFPVYSVTFPDKTKTYFFIILSLGFHANLLHLCTKSPEYLKMGVERFQLASSHILDTYDLNLHVSVRRAKPLNKDIGEETTNEELLANGSFAYFAIVNTPNLEPKYVPSPLSNPVSEQLYLLAYSSKLDSKTLVDNIMQGYHNEVGSPIGQDLVKNGITYLPLLEDFKIELQFSGPHGQDPSYKAEVCCDGLLYNLDRFQNPIISVRFGGDSDFPFQLKVITRE